MWVISEKGGGNFVRSGEVMEKVDSALQFWRYVQLSDLALPQTTVSSSIKGGIKGLWQRLRGNRTKDEVAGKKELALEQIPGALTERIAPDIDWQLPAAVLKVQLEELLALDGLFDKKTDQTTCFLVVGLPHGGNEQTLKILSESAHWQTIDQPTTEQILSQDNNWLKQIETCDTPWVLPALERCYLRHVHGLALVRQLFEMINTRAMGPGVIGCDSWALAYLKHVLPGRLPPALVAQPFDDQRLSRWFYQQALTGCNRPVVFCHTHNGEPVFPADREGGQAGAFMNQLAAHTFGIPGIAISLWRKALRQEPDRAAGDEAPVNTCQGLETTLWVLPWDKLTHPSLTAPVSSETSIILHTLLLHNGLSQEALAEILPFSTHGVTRAVWALKDAGLIEKADGLWIVSPGGYPMVRKYLHGEGYLTDSF